MMDRRRDLFGCLSPVYDGQRTCEKDRKMTLQLLCYCQEREGGGRGEGEGGGGEGGGGEGGGSGGVGGGAPYPLPPLARTLHSFNKLRLLSSMMYCNVYGIRVASLYSDLFHRHRRVPVIRNPRGCLQGCLQRCPQGCLQGFLIRSM